VDFGLFNNRLSGSVELYNKDTRNLLYTYQVPIGDKYGDGLTYISSSFLANIGTMNNKGIELSLDFLAVDKNDFQWRTALNAAHNVNKVVRLSGEGLTFPEVGIRFGTINRGTNAYGPYAILKEGLPVGTFWGPKEVGLNENGEPLYEVVDQTTGAVIEPTADPGRATRQNLGNAQPKVTLGWTNNVTYKNFDLSVFVRSALGQKVFNAANLVFNNPTTFRAGDRYPTNVYRSTFEGDNVNLKVPGAVSSRYVEDGSFVRVDNVNLGYTIPFKASWIRSVRVYGAAQNLLVLTGYRGLDPEVRSGTTTNAYGGVNNTADNLAFGLDDFFFYPRARTFTIGLSAGF
jgi:iron complex outermembrane receptor protein